MKQKQCNRIFYKGDILYLPIDTRICQKTFDSVRPARIKVVKVII